MNFFIPLMIVGLLVLSVCTSALATDKPEKKEFKEPVQLKAAGKVINVSAGHAAPYILDFDGDGVNDLLVGQFGDGLLNFYKNTGSNKEPKYEASKLVQAGGENASVPTS